MFAVRRSLRAWLGGLLLVCSCGAAGCMPNASGRVGAWIVDDLTDVRVDSPPDMENAIYSASRATVRLRAALNETLAFQIVTRTANPPAGPLDIAFTALRTGAGATLPVRPTFDVYRVHYARVDQYASWYPAHTGRPALPTLFPDLLVPWDAPRGGGPLLLGEARNELIWVDVHIPATTAPGLYVGDVYLRDARGGNVFHSALQVEVVPLALPGAPTLPVLCRIDPRQLLAESMQWPSMPAEQLRLLPREPTQRAALELVNATMRVFQQHGTTPLLWASFPKFQPVGARDVDVEWPPYDELVTPWLNGTGFADRARLSAWNIPASIDYPAADLSDGLGSPRYARILGAYLRACRTHFTALDWLQRSWLRLVPPRALTADFVTATRQAAAIVRQSESGLPLVAHLPARSLAGLGWQGAPDVQLDDVAVLAPPAMWYEPAAMEQQRSLGRHTWLLPDRPPYSGSLTVESPPTDACALGWLAYRYGVEALWIENAVPTPVELGGAADPLIPAANLVVGGARFGVPERPIVTRRLKLLRRGMQDHALLRLLEANGQRLLAETLARQMIPWAGTDASEDNLLTTRAAAWPRDPALLRSAHEVLLAELAAGGGSGIEPNADVLARWGMLLNQAGRVMPRVDGVRLLPGPQGLYADTRVSVVNATGRVIRGVWRLAGDDAAWRLAESQEIEIEPGGRRTTRLALEPLAGGWGGNGVQPIHLTFDAATIGTIDVPGRLAVAACPLVTHSPRIDGRLDDWRLATNNQAGDFQLVLRPPDAAGSSPTPPTLATRAFFVRDANYLYVGVRCALDAGVPPVWRADNRIPVDGAVPWGQDVVEILLDPRPADDGTAADIYCLQIKPTGLLVATHGCRMNPPMGAVVPWDCGAQVAVQVERDAWVMELALPLAALGSGAQDTVAWGCNVTRLDARRGEYSSWSGTRGHCYLPYRLGNLLLPRP